MLLLLYGEAFFFLILAILLFAPIDNNLSKKKPKDKRASFEDEINKLAKKLKK